jgi:lysophospholipase L1-like esterase
MSIELGSVLNRSNTAVIFGDSITNQNTAAGQFNAYGYFSAANAIMGWPLTLLNNAGVSGNTTTQMLARVATDVAAYRPGYAVVLGGQNDPANAINAATSLANLTAIYDYLRATGTFVVCCSIMSSSGDTDAIRTFKATVNRAIQAYAETNAGCAFADFNLAYTDPTTSAPYTGASFDGTHPSPKGAMLLGRCLAEVLGPLVSGMNTGPNAIISPLVYSSNPFAAGDNADATAGFALTTGVTGTGPNGWTCGRRNTGTGVASKVARSGSWRSDPYARMVASFAADNDGAGFMFGGNDVLAKGRYDQNWAASTAYTYGDRKKPTAANGYHYLCVTPGTTGASQPTWPTTEGATVTDGTVTWLCQRTPTTGDTFVAEVDLALSGLTAGKWAVPVLRLDCLDTTSTTVASAYANFHDLSGAMGAGSDYAPPTLRLKTPVLTIPNFGAQAIRYLRAQVIAYGQAGGSLTMDVARAAIRRVSP